MACAPWRGKFFAGSEPLGFPPFFKVLNTAMLQEMGIWKGTLWATLSGETGDPLGVEPTGSDMLAERQGIGDI